MDRLFGAVATVVTRRPVLVVAAVVVPSLLRLWDRRRPATHAAAPHVVEEAPARP